MDKAVHRSHSDVVKRLKRAEGHLKRVIAMFDEGRACLDLAQQLHAVEKAIGEAKKVLIHDHVDHCLDAAANGQDKQARLAIGEFKAISSIFSVAEFRSAGKRAIKASCEYRA